MTTHIDHNSVLFSLPSTGEFPTVEDFRRYNPYGWSGVHGAWWELPDEVLSWFVVLSDPRSLTYFDEDHRAMDETNHDAVAGVIADHDEVPSLVTTVSVLVRDDVAARLFRESEEECVAAGAFHVGRVLVMSPDHESLDDVRDCSRSLADYPLLDEDAYSSREWDAWQDYAPTALADEIRYDVAATTDEVLSRLMGEEWRDVVEDHADDILPVVCQHLHHYAGFSGEYGPPMLDVLADLVTTHEDDRWSGRSAREVREVLDIVDTASGLDVVPGQTSLSVH